MPEVRDVMPATTKEEEEKKKKEEERKKKDLSEEEKQVMMMSEPFQKFFDRATRVVERALCEDINVFVDYTGGYEDGEGLEDKTGGKLSLNRYFYDERWTKNRVITTAWTGHNSSRSSWSPATTTILTLLMNQTVSAWSGTRGSKKRLQRISSIVSPR